MERSELASALAALGMRCAAAEIVVVGGAAAILCQWLERTTVDVDVAVSDPRLAALAGEIEAVAEELGLPRGWINDSAKAFSGVLPSDFRERLIEVGRWGGLRVLAIGRRDFILMKLFAMRAEDVLDLRALAPTPEELNFVRGELPRIASFDPRRAHLMSLYLEQGGSP